MVGIGEVNVGCDLDTNVRLRDGLWDRWDDIYNHLTTYHLISLFSLSHVVLVGWDVFDKNWPVREMVVDEMVDKIFLLSLNFYHLTIHFTTYHHLSVSQLTMSSHLIFSNNRRWYGICCCWGNNSSKKVRDDGRWWYDGRWSISSSFFLSLTNLQPSSYHLISSHNLLSHLT